MQVGATEGSQTDDVFIQMEDVSNQPSSSRSPQQSVHMDEDSTQTPSSSKEINRLSDLDRGIQLMSEMIFSNNKENHYGEIVKTLIQVDKDQKNKMILHKASKRRWTYIERGSAVFAITLIALALIAESVDQLFNSNDKTQLKARIAIVISVAGIALIGSLISGVAQYLIGPKYRYNKHQAKLQTKDTETVKKITAILESLGQMARAQENQNETINLEQVQKECFENIRNLSDDEIKDKGLPDKTELASLAIQKLPLTHRIRKQFNVIMELQKPTSNDDDEAFHDIGQKAGKRPSPPTISHTPEDRYPLLKKEWEKICKMMGNLPVEHLYCKGGICITNQSPRNPYYPEEYHNDE